MESWIRHTRSHDVWTRRPVKTSTHTHHTLTLIHSFRETSTYDSSSQRPIKTLQKTHLALRYHYYLQQCIQRRPCSLSPRHLGGRRMRGGFIPPRNASFIQRTSPLIAWWWPIWAAEMKGGQFTTRSRLTDWMAPFNHRWPRRGLISITDICIRPSCSAQSRAVSGSCPSLSNVSSFSLPSTTALFGRLIQVSWSLL